ncbi:MAG: nuclear transport factor 2 family protein, partial [Actinomycetales bacterium]
MGDREEIHDLVLAYCRAVDRLQLDDVRAVYARDGIDHHTGFDGSADEYVAWLRGLLPHLDGTQHLVANHLSEVRGDRAVAETYGQAVHWGT